MGWMIVRPPVSAPLPPWAKASIPMPVQGAAAKMTIASDGAGQYFIGDPL